MKSLLAAALLGSALLGVAYADPPQIKSEGHVEFPAWRQLVLTSPSLQRDFMVRIIPPVAPLAPEQKAAVIYLLDGNMYSGMAGDTMRLMAFEPGLYSSAYVVAIGYDTTNPAVIIANRQNDYLHAETLEPGKTTPYGGGGAAFETFLIDELKPFIEARLPVDPAGSILAGHSYGGLFVANLIQRNPGAFAGYAIGSPSIWADPDLPEKFKSLRGENRRVFVGVGSLEIENGIDMVRDAETLSAALGVAGFEVRKRIYEGQSHGASPNPWMADSFRFLLARSTP